jgi:hypothetical protein
MHCKKAARRREPRKTALLFRGRAQPAHGRGGDWAQSRSFAPTHAFRSSTHDRSAQEAQRRGHRHHPGGPQEPGRLHRHPARSQPQLAGHGRLHGRARHACAAARCRRPAGFGAGRHRTRAGAVRAGSAAGGAARRRLQAQRRGPATFARAGRAVVGAGQLPVRSVQAAQARRRGAAAGVQCRCAARHRHRHGDLRHARPGQHTGRAHGPRRAGRRRASRGPAARRHLQADRRRRAAEGQLPRHPRGRPCRHARAAPDRAELGQAQAPEADAGRQGRLLRQRRPGHQGRRRHAPDEEGHGRRRQCAGRWPRW